MTTEERIQALVEQVATENGMDHSDARELGLMKQGFDSLMLVDLIFRIEDAFDVRFADDAAERGVYHSVQTLSAEVRSRFD